MSSPKNVAVGGDENLLADTGVAQGPDPAEAADVGALADLNGTVSHGDDGGLSDKDIIPDDYPFAVFALGIQGAPVADYHIPAE